MTEKPKQLQTTPTISNAPLSMAELLAQVDTRDEEDVAEISELAPLSAVMAPNRSKRTMPVADLAGLAKLWLMFGEGNSGKTMFARYLIDHLIQNGKLDLAAVAALASGNRNLEKFVEAVM